MPNPFNNPFFNPQQNQGPPVVAGSDPSQITYDPLFGGAIPTAIPLPRTQPTHNSTGEVVDPLTGRVFDVSQLGYGAESARAQLAHAQALDVLQEERRGEALSLLGDVLQGFQPAQQFAQQFAEQVQDPTRLEELGRLLFARGANEAAETALGVSRQAASALGGRGISASSGLATGLASQIDLARSAQVRGVERDVRIELLRRTAQDHAQAFSQLLAAQQAQAAVAGNIADVTLMLPTNLSEASQGLTELILETRAAKKAAKAGKRAGNIQAVTGIATGLAGLAGI